MLKINQFANLIPQMTDVEFSELKASISKSGQHIPIVLHNGEILDGRNRYRACCELGIEPVFETRDDVDPFQFAIDMITRRNLTQSQTAMTVAGMVEIVNKLREEAKEAQVRKPADSVLATLPKQIDDADDSFPDPPAPKHVHVEAAKLANVSPKTMQHALKVEKQGTEELKEAVRSGDVPVGVAAKVADLPAAAQNTAVATNTTRQAAAEAPAIKRESPKVAEFITLDTWDKMDSASRVRALSTKSDKGFNRQDGDGIEWAQWSWNPITGCLHGCSYCYARDIANRFYDHKFAPAIAPERLSAPSNTRISDSASINQRNVFTCSMSDLMGAWNPAEWIQAVIDRMSDHPKFNFLLLTKNPARYQEFDFPSNCWLGATIDRQERVAPTIAAFRALSGDNIRWVSFEPLSEFVSFAEGDLELIDWAVIGGQTGANPFRPKVDWWADLHVQARSYGCAVYHKANIGLDPSVRCKEFPVRGERRAAGIARASIAVPKNSVVLSVEEHDELISMLESLNQAQLDMESVLLADDKLAAASADSKRLNEHNRVLQSRLNGELNKNAELIKLLKNKEKTIAKLQKEVESLQLEALPV